MDSMDQNRPDGISTETADAGSRPADRNVPADTVYTKAEGQHHTADNENGEPLTDAADHTKGSPEPEAVIEAILFTMGDSVPLEKLAAALEISTEETRAVLEQMTERYEQEDRGIGIIELDGSYQMCTKKEMYEYLIRVARQPGKQILTDVLLETLSIIAYKQPVTKQEIEKIRGVSSSHAVNKLVEYELVCEVGRLEAPGRPLLFGTTEAFLRSFGVNSLDELPRMEPERVEEFRQEAEEELEIRLKV